MRAEMYKKADVVFLMQVFREIAEGIAEGAFFIVILGDLLKDAHHRVDVLVGLRLFQGNAAHDRRRDALDRGGKLAFSTRRGNVLYIEAADNYSNIHYINEDKEDTFILHNSMKQLDSSDEYKSLLRCHRGYMVNIDNVKLLKKEKGILVLELTQGARSIPVSKTYTDRVVRFFAGENEA